MYNRYIPNGTAYTRVLEEDAPPFTPVSHQEPLTTSQEAHQEQAPHHSQEAPNQDSHQHYQAPPHKSESPPGRPGTAGEKKIPFLSDILKKFKLDDLDTGDILLLLILLFLVLDGDGDNMELIITLGLVVLFSLGDKEKNKEKESD